MTKLKRAKPCICVLRYKKIISIHIYNSSFKSLIKKGILREVDCRIMISSLSSNIGVTPNNRMCFQKGWDGFKCSLNQVRVWSKWIIIYKLGSKIWILLSLWGNMRNCVGLPYRGCPAVIPQLAFTLTWLIFGWIYSRELSRVSGWNSNHHILSPFRLR